jgi:hypothetical protein
MSARYPIYADVVALYAYWRADDDWQVVARARVVDGKVAVVSAQFLPPRKPQRVISEPLPASTPELEYA